LLFGDNKGGTPSEQRGAGSNGNDYARVHAGEREHAAGHCRRGTAENSGILAWSHIFATRRENRSRDNQGDEF
jgi:hypothetical protein